MGGISGKHSNVNVWNGMGNFRGGFNNYPVPLAPGVGVCPASRYRTQHAL